MGLRPVFLSRTEFSYRRAAARGHLSVRLPQVRFCYLRGSMKPQSLVGLFAVFASIFVFSFFTPGLEVHAESLDSQSRCFLMTMGTPDVDAPYETFCRFVREHIASKVDTSFYLKAKEVVRCETPLDFETLKKTDTLFSRVKPAEQWDITDLADVVRLEMECRSHLGLKNHFAHEAGRDLDSRVIFDVFETFGCQAVVEKERVAQEAAWKVKQAKEATAAKEKQEHHLRALAEAGYRPVNLSEIQINGRSMLGQKVAVRGYVRIFSDEAGRIYTNEDDLNGVDLDISSGSPRFRRTLLENCSSISHSCPVELMATVVQGSQRPTLKLD